MAATIWEAFRDFARCHPDKIAIICGSESISYGKLLQCCESLSVALCRAGVGKEMHIGVLMEKSINFAVAVLSLMRVGAIVIPLSTYYTNQETLTAIDAADMERIVSNDTMCARITVIEERFPQRLIRVPHWREISMEENVGDAQQSENCIYLMTSGSTGQPKIAIISQAAMRFRLDLEILHFSLNEDDRVLISTPIYHSLGIRILLTGLYSGMTVVLLRGFTPETWLNEIQAHQITYTITVPSQISQIVEAIGDDIDGGREKMRSIRTIMSTSAYLPGNMKTAFLKLVSGRFLNFLASSETEFMVWSDCSWEDTKGDLLGIPFPGVDIKLLDGDTFAAPGQTGEILCSSQQQFTEYYRNPYLSQQSHWKQYYRTGDLGVFDNQGRLHYAGRKKDTIICSGVNIIPRDVEDALLKHPHISECVAFGIPHEKYGEILAVLVSGSEINESEIKRYCLKHLAIHQQPRRIFLCDQLPRNEMGKLKKDALKKYYSL